MYLQVSGGSSEAISFNAKFTKQKESLKECKDKEVNKGRTKKGTRKSRIR
jgi:hypothetical protein